MSLIASFNVNSVKARLPILLDYLRHNAPDVLALQELKCPSEEFPLLEIQELGYHSLLKGQKSYNGVAILTKTPADLISDNLSGNIAEESRFIWAKWQGINIVNIYAPNGNSSNESEITLENTEKFQKKMRFMQDLWHLAQNTWQKLAEPLLILGDYNICPTDNDCYDAKLLAGDAILHEMARKSFYALINCGFIDVFDALNPQAPDRFSYWDYQGGKFQKNQGVRIDHILANGLAFDKITQCFIDKKPRIMERPSDHTPICALLI